MGRYRGPRLNKICIICGAKYQCLPSKNERKYCSQDCYRKRIVSNEARLKMSIASKGKKQEDKNPMWKGDNVGIKALHDWIRDHKPKSEFCEECGKVQPYDLANISGEYKRDINDFEWLCRRCHMIKDGRMKNLKHFQNKNGKR